MVYNQSFLYPISNWDLQRLTDVQTINPAIFKSKSTQSARADYKRTFFLFVSDSRRTSGEVRK